MDAVRARRLRGAVTSLPSRAGRLWLNGHAGSVSSLQSGRVAIELRVLLLEVSRRIPCPLPRVQRHCCSDFTQDSAHSELKPPTTKKQLQSLNSCRPGTGTRERKSGRNCQRRPQVQFVESHTGIRAQFTQNRVVPASPTTGEQNGLHVA